MRWLKGFLWTAGALALLLGLAFWMRPLDIFNDFTYLQEAFSGVHNQWAWVDGYRMHYEVEGPAAGPPVVLVHGLGGRAEDWRALAPYLAKAGYRVYMPDLIGYGRSDQPSNFSYSIHDEAALVVAFFSAVGVKQADLGGWSMGGWIVQTIAATHPERIKRLLIFDSAGLYVRPTWDTRLFTPTSVAQLRELDALLMPHPPRIPEFVASDILRVSRQSGWVVQRAMAQMLTGQDVTDNLLPHLRMPVLIEWGSADRIIPLDQGQKMHSLIPKSHLDVYAGCGHLAPLQCAGEMGPNVVRFLQTTPAATAPQTTLTPIKTAPHGPQRPRAEAASLESARAASDTVGAQN
jgi:pimeloyl-ACP methyl ester carboxylesterase